MLAHPVAAWKLAVALADAGCRLPSQEGFSAFGHERALPVPRSCATEDPVPVEDGAVGFPLELLTEEDRVEHDALRVYAADAGLLRELASALAAERDELWCLNGVFLPSAFRQALEHVSKRSQTAFVRP